jgi:hypothetical protein
VGRRENAKKRNGIGPDPITITIPGTSMYLVARNEYDGGGVGDGNLTESLACYALQSTAYQFYTEQEGDRSTFDK